MLAAVVDDSFVCVRRFAIVRAFLDVDVDIAAELDVLTTLDKRELHVHWYGGASKRKWGDRRFRN